MTAQAPEVDPRGLAAQTAVVVAALRAAGSAAYDVGEAHHRTNTPAAWTEVHVSDRLPEVLREDGTSDERRYRVLTRTFSRDYPGALAETDKVRAALLWRELPTSYGTTGALAPVVDPDPVERAEGWWRHVREFVYTA
ncbi:hypothetical protein [Nocardioides marmoraquaticus]